MPETCQDSLRTPFYDLSTALALLGVTPLRLGAWKACFVRASPLLGARPLFPRHSTRSTPPCRPPSLWSRRRHSSSTSTRASCRLWPSGSKIQAWSSPQFLKFSRWWTWRWWERWWNLVVPHPTPPKKEKGIWIHIWECLGKKNPDEGLVRVFKGLGFCFNTTLHYKHVPYSHQKKKKSFAPITPHAPPPRSHGRCDFCHLSGTRREVNSKTKFEYTFDKLYDTFYDLLDEFKKLGLKTKELKKYNMLWLKKRRTF